jgi:hypothetical protein
VIDARELKRISDIQRIQRETQAALEQVKFDYATKIKASTNLGYISIVTIVLSCSMFIFLDLSNLIGPKVNSLLIKHKLIKPDVSKRPKIKYKRKIKRFKYFSNYQ